MTKEEVKQAVSEAMEEKLGGFFVEREQHYQDHEFICAVRNLRDKVRAQACKTVTNGSLVAAGTLLLWGVVYFIKSLVEHK